MTADNHFIATVFLCYLPHIT